MIHVAKYNPDSEPSRLGSCFVGSIADGAKQLMNMAVAYPGTIAENLTELEELKAHVWAVANRLADEAGLDWRP